MKKDLPNLGKRVKVIYTENEDNLSYEGILSGFTDDGEYIVGMENIQHGEGWKYPSSVEIIRHPMNYYIYAYKCDTVIEFI